MFFFFFKQKTAYEMRISDWSSDVCSSDLTSADWLQRMENGGVPGGPVLNVSEMHNDPQTLAREMVVELDHPRAGRVKTIGLPVKFSATPGGVRAPAPLYGQHTRAVLAEYGYDAAEIDRLIAEGAIVAEEKLAAE